MSKKKKIAVFTTPQGHLSIADAVTQKIEQLAGDEFEVVQFFSNSVLMKEYGMIYKFAPSVFSLPYTLSKLQKVTEVFSSLSSRKFLGDIEAFIEKEQPDLCINTNFVYNSSLEKVCEQKGLPFLNVLANPGVSHPAEVATRANYNLVLNDETRFELEEKYPDATFFTTGWFVRSGFEAEYSPTKLRKKYTISPEKFHVLIASGSEGTSAITKILPSLLRVNDPAIITVACGKSKLLSEQVTILAKFVKKISPDLEVRVLGFTKKIHEHMQAADIVVGKAGPNMLFESIATKTPFFAITHVAGQEDINLEIIQNKKLGFVEESLIGASKLLEKIIIDPSVLDEFEKPVAAMAQHNHKSGERLLTVVRRLI